jgi:hypothetical protein
MHLEGRFLRVVSFSPSFPCGASCSLMAACVRLSLELLILLLLLRKQITDLGILSHILLPVNRLSNFLVHDRDKLSTYITPSWKHGEETNEHTAGEKVVVGVSFLFCILPYLLGREAGAREKRHSLKLHSTP